MEAAEGRRGGGEGRHGHATYSGCAQWRQLLCPYRPANHPPTRADDGVGGISLGLHDKLDAGEALRQAVLQQQQQQQQQPV